MKKKAITIMCLLAITITTAMVAPEQSFAYTQQPWEIKAGDKTIATVESEEEGKEVITKVMMDYYPDMEEQLKTETDPVLTVEPSTAKTKALTVKRAIKKIEAQNQTKKPAFEIVNKQIEEVNETIAYNTKIKKTDEMYQGESKVIQSGKTGSKHVIKNVIKTNGQISDEIIASSSITKKPVTKIVLKGVKDPTEKTRKQVVAFAMKYLGTRYVWGGESLTGGIDCSGFTMQVYAHFGYDLPHYSGAQAECGTKIDSLAEAKSGDLIIYKGHVAIYCGDGTIVHATPPKIICGTPADYSEILAIRRII